MTVATTGRRERKKLDTYRALSEAAQELVLERGLDEVTVEDIAEAADVSVRTFFNYFQNKEAAVVGTDAAALSEFAQQLRDRPPREGPMAALRAVLLPGDDVTEVLKRWVRRNELIRRYPSLRARHLASVAELEDAMADAMAERLGVDPVADPTPRVVVAASLAAIRATLSWWLDSDRRTSLTTAIDRSLNDLPSNLSPRRPRKK
jgi:AcrR family transcriptional regulator